MTEKRWDRARILFESVYDLEPNERALRLEQDCGDDPTLRAEVESLLAAHSHAPVVFETPSFDALAQLSTPDESWIGRSIGAYKVVRHIASGGMGTVYEGARADDQYEKTVAIKLLHRGLASSDVLRRFRNERQALANLDHPYVDRLHDGGVTQDGLPYLVMEYIIGRPLIRYCNEERLTVVERLKLFQKICHAVQYAHQHLIVHRDLKPNNILITEDGNPKLLDFGIAKILAPDSTEQVPDVTVTSARAFTPDYGSPEQIRCDIITTATDIYSLGVVLYELLTSHRPYRLSNRSFSEIEHIACEHMPEKPSTRVTRVEEVVHSDGRTGTTISPDSVSAERNTTPLGLRRNLRGELDTIMMMAMRKEPNRRYASAEQFSEDIRRYLNRLPLLARTDTLGYRASRFIVRNKTGVVAATLIALSLVGGLAGVAVQSREVTTQRDLARENARRAEEVSEFLIDLFAVSDPRHSLGENITAREMLDRGAGGTGEVWRARDTKLDRDATHR